MSKKELVTVKQVVDELRVGGVELSPGDFVVGSRLELYKVEGITKDGIQWREQENDGTWGDIRTESVHDFLYYHYIKLEKPLEEYEKELGQHLVNIEAKYDEQEEVSDSQELATKSDVHQLEGMKRTFEKKKNYLEVMNRVLEAKRWQMQQLVSKMSKKIRKVMQVIDIIELYLGVHETIMQIQEGPVADMDEPISFRQLVLYMDEEVGDPKDEGLDFKKIEQFDSWLLKDENYKKVLPEEKGVVVIKPRRHSRDYGDWFTNQVYNAENKRTYILIRNGMNFYRIWSNIDVGERFFPTKEEQQKMFETMQADNWETDREKAADEILGYRRNSLMMQGLIDRTKVFQPMSHYVVVSKPETYDGLVQFIHDGELVLTDGRVRFRDWREQINSKIERGTRIIFAGFPWNEFESSSGRGRDYSYRFPCSPEHLPGPGLYTIEEILPALGHWGTERLVCRYFQGGERYEGWGYQMVERKNRTMFWLHRGDSFVLNYDLMTLEDVEFYIDCRLDREHYLSMIPLLWWLKKKRLEELKWERGFVENLKLRMNYPDKEKLEKIIWECINWWKMKVIWKRPIMEDDAKALRMITSRVHLMIGNEIHKAMEVDWL